MTTRKPGFALPVAVTLAILLAGYVGTYYGTVNVISVPMADGLVPIYRGAELGRAQKYLRRLFSSIHWLDRRIRPHVWKLE